MILPIYLYGNPILRQNSNPVDLKDPKLTQFVNDLYDTMYHAKGVGLAANQVGKASRIFVIDASVLYFEDKLEDRDPTTEELEVLQKKYKKAFINPEIIEERGEIKPFLEGCLSIPNLYETVRRPSEIVLSYWDEKGIFHEKEVFDGLIARVILHEYDHINGKLFFDKLSPLQIEMMKGSLDKIKKGTIKVDYKVIKV